MKPNGFGMAVVGFALFGAGVVGLAAEKIDLGKQEYGANCAACHGLSGTGDGPYKPYITGSPADLTVLERSNKGVFPFAHVYQVIDGRTPMSKHGTSDMLIWGREFSRKAGEYYMEVPGDPEVYARERILALTEYVSQIQVK
jgi:mono/diheme cytochrome c family protein